MKYKGNLPIDFFNSGVKTALMLSCSRGEEQVSHKHKHTHPHYKYKYVYKSPDVPDVLAMLCLKLKGAGERQVWLRVTSARALVSCPARKNQRKIPAGHETRGPGARSLGTRPRAVDILEVVKGHIFSKLR